MDVLETAIGSRMPKRSGKEWRRTAREPANPLLDPRYLMETDFYSPLTARLGLKFSF